MGTVLGRLGTWLITTPSAPLSKKDSAWLLGMVVVRAVFAAALVYLGLNLAISGRVNAHGPAGIFVAIVGLGPAGLAVLRLRAWLSIRRRSPANS